MEIHQLRYVLAVAQERHFQRAAEKVFVTQPTLSQQIRKLEKELRVALFDRSSRQVRLTPEGERFVPLAQAALDALDRAAAEFRDPPGEPAGPVLLGAIPTIAPYILPAVAAGLRQKAPKITLQLDDLPTEALLRALKDGRIELALLSLPIEPTGIETRALGREPMYVAVAKNHPLAKAKSVAGAALEKERLLMLQEGHCFRDQALDFCHRSHIKPQVVFQGSSLTSVLRMAAAGEGVTFVPHMAVHPRENPGLRFVRFKPPVPHREIAVAWRQRSPLGARQRLVVEVIARAVAQATRRRSGPAA